MIFSWADAAIGFLTFACLIIGARVLLRNTSSLSALPIAPPSESSFLWGHEYRAFKGQAVEEYRRWATNIAPVFRIKAALFQKDVIIITDNLACSHIFQNAYDYVKPPAFIPLVLKVLGRGLVWAEGAEHKHLRKLVSHAFTVGAVNNMAEDVFKCAEKCVECIAHDLETTADREAPINLTRYMSPCTLEVIARVGFGQEFPHNSQESIDINASWRQDVEAMSTFGGFLAPIVLSIFPWITKLPIPALQKDTITKTTILRIGKKLIEEQNMNPDGKDIFSLLVKDWSLTPVQLLENILTFLVAGHETTAATLTLTIYELARNQSLQDNLRKELENIDLGNFIEVDRLAYLDAVTREGLRLHPSAHDSERVSTKEDVIPLRTPIKLLNGQTVTSLKVRAGERFVIPWIAMNTDHGTWGPDADEFKPERWTTPGGVPSSGLPHGPYSNLASFADGPRACIGWRLAVMELKIILGVLIKAFKFEDTGVHITRRQSPGLTPFVDGKASQMPLYIRPIA